MQRKNLPAISDEQVGMQPELVVVFCDVEREQFVTLLELERK